MVPPVVFFGCSLGLFFADIVAERQRLCCFSNMMLWLAGASGSLAATKDLDGGFRPMTRSSWRVLAFGALLASVALPASAQVVVGGSSAPNVEVNWSVLDNLGRQPNLADMLKTEPLPGEAQAAQPRNRAPQGVQYRPYKPGAQPYAKGKSTAKVAQKAPAKKAPAQKAKVTPASAKADHMADLVQSSRSEPKAEAPRKAAAPALPPKPDVTPVVEAPKATTPAVAGPQVSLPEVPKPTAAPVQQVKAPELPPAAKVVEEPKVELPKAAEAPKAEAPALPPTALTPPPMPVAKVEPKPEPAPAPVQAVVPAPAPQQIAALPPSPAPVAASGFKGDTLTIPFTGESARVPDGSLSDLDRLAKRMLKDESLGLQLLAYADGDDANASKARRLSLSRALEVRKYLMDQGLRSTRIEVRALGNKLEGTGSPDRVDAVLVSR